MTARAVANHQILGIIARYLKEYPDVRFHQALQNLGLEVIGGDDLWPEESWVTLELLENRVSKPDDN